MKLIRLAYAYLKQAEARLNDAKDAYKDKNNPYTVRLCQECVELSVKAVLRAVGIEYPKEHEVSYLLSQLQARFPPWFTKDIPFIQETSKALFRKREIAFYGGEEAFLTPEDVIGKNDARTAVKSADRVFRLSKRLVNEVDHNVS